MFYYKKLNVNRICIWGFLLRLFFLSIVLLFSNNLSTGLLGSDYIQDDVRYLAGAEIYAQTASGILDSQAIESAFDRVEPSAIHSNGMELWYWIISISMLILKNEMFVRLLNILFAIVSIKCIYDICSSLYDTEVAKLASFLYAVMPYPVIFSCFLYKDQFYTMLTLLLFRKAINCAGHITLKDVLFMIVGLILSQLTRSGVVVLIIIALVIIIYKRGNYKVNILALIGGLVISVIVLWYVVMLNMEDITKKMYVYVLENTEAGGDSTIGMFEIKSLGQLYRYPFAYLFALVQPLSLSLVGLNNWMQLAGICNIVALPIAIANFFYLINFNYKKDYFFWIAQMLFFVTILASLGIVRHQYYLQPFIMIFFACYYYNSPKHNLLKLSSIVVCLGLIIVWAVRLFLCEHILILCQHYFS